MRCEIHLRPLASAMARSPADASRLLSFVGYRKVPKSRCLSGTRPVAPRALKGPLSCATKSPAFCGARLHQTKDGGGCASHLPELL